MFDVANVDSLRLNGTDYLNQQAASQRRNIFIGGVDHQEILVGVIERQDERGLNERLFTELDLYLRGNMPALDLLNFFAAKMLERGNALLNLASHNLSRDNFLIVSNNDRIATSKRRDQFASTGNDSLIFTRTTQYKIVSKRQGAGGVAVDVGFSGGSAAPRSYVNNCTGEPATGADGVEHADHEVGVTVNFDDLSRQEKRELAQRLSDNVRRKRKKRPPE